MLELSSFTCSFCQLSGSSLVCGVLEFQEGESRWDSFHALCGASGLKTSLLLQLWNLSFIMSLIISSLPYSPLAGGFLTTSATWEALVLFQRHVKIPVVKTFLLNVNCHPPGSSVHGISQARILVRVVFPPPEDLLNPGIEPISPALPG